MRVRSKRRTGGRAETGLPDHVDGIEPKMLGPGHRIENPGRGIGLRAVEEDDRRPIFPAKGQHEGLALARGQAQFADRHRPAVQHLAIETPYGLGSLG